MILATRKPNGKVVYFDARTGNQYKPYREPGRHMGHIPDDVIRFLTPKIEHKTGINSNPPKMSEPIVFKNPPFVSRPKKPSWIQLIWSWIKNLFGNAGK